MTGITTFNEQDVLCGRGGGTLRHPGNKKYRSMIKSSKPVYLMSSKNEKTAISRSIVATVRKNNGRFLERSKNMEFWYDIGDAKATEKTSQALREGQPKLRKKMIDHGIIKENFRSGSAENTNSIVSTTSVSQIDPNPVFVGDESYSSVDKNETNIMEQQQKALEESVHRMMADIQPKPILDQSLHIIGNGRFHPTDCRGNTTRSQFDKPHMRIVTPPTTPPNQTPQPISRKTQRRMSNEMNCPFYDDGFGTDMMQNVVLTDNMVGDDFDDSNSIMTFEMDDEDMMNDDGDDLLTSSIHSHKSIFPTTTPLPTQTNHFRALSELRDNVPMYDQDGDQTMIQHTTLAQPSPISKHLRALTELKDQVPTYPSFSSQGNNAFNDDLPMGCSSMGFGSSLVFPTQGNI